MENTAFENGGDGSAERDTYTPRSFIPVAPSAASAINAAVPMQSYARVEGLEWQGCGGYDSVEFDKTCSVNDISKSSCLSETGWQEDFSIIRQTAFNGMISSGFLSPEAFYGRVLETFVVAADLDVFPFVRAAAVINGFNMVAGVEGAVSDLRDGGGDIHGFQ